MVDEGGRFEVEQGSASPDVADRQEVAEGRTQRRQDACPALPESLLVSVVWARAPMQHRRSGRWHGISWEDARARFHVLSQGRDVGAADLSRV